MVERVSNVVRDLGWRLHGFVLGVSLAGGAMMVGQGCAATGA